MQNYIRLTPSYDKNGNLYLIDGLIAFRLGLWVEGKEIDKLTVFSGGPSKQNKASLKIYSDPMSIPGSAEPIPEGQYRVDPYEFAVANSYSGSWGEGLGPVWFPIIPLGNGRRNDFGIHLDANGSYAPGSMGCIVTSNINDLKIIVEWQKRYKFNLLVVDYSLGTVAKPNKETAPVPPPAKPEMPEFKFVVNENGSTLYIYEPLAVGQYTVFSNDTGWTGKLKKKKS